MACLFCVQNTCKLRPNSVPSILYKPRTHDLEKLGQRVTSVDTRFLAAFPKGSEDEKECFNLLRKAYVDARYNPNHVITKEPLEWLVERVNHLKQLTETLCQEKIKSFG